MKHTSKRKIGRRQFLRNATAATAGVWVAGTQAWADAERPGRRAVAAGDKLNVAFVGVGGRGAANIQAIEPLTNVNVVALCDVDASIMAPVAAHFPRAKAFSDYRRLLDAVKEIDAVVVSTPDHTHAFATMAAMRAGKHVYCEKPLTHCLYEARTVRETAASLKCVTQMGTNIHAEPNYRRVVELVKAGAIGAVREAHVFSAACWATTERVTEAQAVPPGLDYDLWLGPTPFRPYNKAYLPASWRRYWAFGTGTLGDMGCHYLDLAFWALDLKHPTGVRAEGPTPDAENCPVSLAAHWDFPARGERPPVKLSWYDGGVLPAVFHEWKLKTNPWSSSVLFVGEKGGLVANYWSYQLLPEEKFKGFTPPPQTIPASIGHHKEWVDACVNNDPSLPLCRFDYSGPLTETVLLGALSFRLGKTLDWDAEHLKVTNAREAEPLIRLPYRKGWTL